MEINKTAKWLWILCTRYVQHTRPIAFPSAFHSMQVVCACYVCICTTHKCECVCMFLVIIFLFTIEMEHERRSKKIKERRNDEEGFLFFVFFYFFFSFCVSFFFKYTQHVSAPNALRKLWQIEEGTREPSVDLMKPNEMKWTAKPIYNSIGPVSHQYNYKHTEFIAFEWCCNGARIFLEAQNEYTEYAV